MAAITAALQRIHRARTLVEALLSGQRPVVCKAHDAWLLQILERMFLEMYLVDDPSMLVTCEGYADETIIPYADGSKAVAKVSAYVSSIHPVTEHMLEQIEELCAISGGASSFYICGGFMSFRTVPYQMYALPLDVTHQYVAPAGDIYTLRDMLELLEYLLSAHISPLSFLIIQNDQGFWDALLDHIGVERNVLEASRIYLSHYAEETWQFVQRFGGVSMPMPSLSAYEALQIPMGSILFVATKTKNKLAEIATIFEGLGVRVLKLENIANFNNPPEISGTYGGNVYEKMCSAFRAVDGVLANANLWSQVQATLCLNGIDAQVQNRMFIMAEDSGLHFNDSRIIAHMDVRGMEAGLRLNHRQSPGQEYGPSIFGKLGEEKFFEQAYEAMRMIYRRTPEQPANSTITNTSVMALAPFFADGQGKRACYVFGGAVLLRLTKHPEIIRKRREKHGFVPVLTTKDYLSPQEANLYHLTISELEERFRDHPSPFNMRDLSYQAMYGHKAHAAWAVMKACGMDQHAAIAPFSVVDAGGDVALNIAVFLGKGKESLPKCVGYRYAYCAIHDDIKGWMHHAQYVTLMHDAFLFLPLQHADDENILDIIFMLFSIIVARQLSPRDMEKPLVMVNPDGGYDGVLAVYHDMRQTAMLPDPDQDFIKEVQDMTGVVPVLEFYRHNFWKETLCVQDVPRLSVEKSHRFNVAVFCSASARNQVLNQVAYDVGYCLAQQNFGMVYGAGDRQMMGNALKGVLAWKKQTGNEVWVSGSSTPDIINIESDDKDGLKATIAAHGQYVEAGDIYQRMDFMIRAAHGFVILPGGAGTVQELALLLKLKAENAPEMQGKSIVMYDPLVSVQEQKSFYSALLHLIPEQVKAALDMQVYRELSDFYAALAAFVPPSTYGEE